MKRQALEDLKNWYQRPGRKPLLLRGARQVGKSTLVRQLAENLELELLEVNLERRPLRSMNEDGVPLERLLQEIEILCNKKIAKNSLIFIDEIQVQGKLLHALRYFFEERSDLAVIAAGSLLDFAIEELGQAPVGRIEYYYLGPMRFTEFLEALDEHLLLDLLQKINPTESLTDTAHEKLTALYKEFLFVGGMPEAVLTYIKTKSPLEVRRVQEAIIATYREDFGKYSKNSQIHRVQRVFDFVPGHLGQKTKYSEIDRDDRSRDLKMALQLLIKARILIPVYHANGKSFPLRSFLDPDIFKLYFLDVGLVNAQQGVPWAEIVGLGQNTSVFKGAISEQFVAQHLFYLGTTSLEPELFYWLRDKKKQNAEVDFLIQAGSQVTPLEIKAETSGTLRSLILFMSETQWPVAVKLSLEKPRSELVEKRVKSMTEPAVFELRHIPIYAVEKIKSLLG